MRYDIKNEKLICEIDVHGAELKSLKRISDGKEYMWSGDPAYWNRTSPVLFPFVGGVKDKLYRHEGKEYTIGQHGFARDMDFTLESQSGDEIWFSLSETEESLGKYPFRFLLGIGYKIEDTKVKVMWEVKNTDDDTMFFSIGAHPGFAVESLKGHAFMLRDKEGKKVTSIKNRVFGKGGCVTDRTEECELQDGVLLLSEELFDNDALVLENDQIGSVTLSDDHGTPSLTVKFDAPLVGLWSPPHKNAPFVCIEPWYGRCDPESFTGELKDRDYEQKLAPGEVFKASYEIVIEGE
ncbi:MAG: aldose 1-epimerase family protein [Lachnospiraceae bacterium]|nr:aldose 1-epimerase family protein [Lachnospiraceae bacterium]